MEEVCPLDMVCREISINCIRMCLPIIAERNALICVSLERTFLSLCSWEPCNSLLCDVTKIGELRPVLLNSSSCAEPSSTARNFCSSLSWCTLPSLKIFLTIFFQILGNLFFVVTDTPCSRRPALSIIRSFPKQESVCFLFDLHAVDCPT